MMYFKIYYDVTLFCPNITIMGSSELGTCNFQSLNQAIKLEFTVMLACFS